MELHCILYLYTMDLSSKILQKIQYDNYTVQKYCTIVWKHCTNMTRITIYFHYDNFIWTEFQNWNNCFFSNINFNKINVDSAISNNFYLLPKLATKRIFATPAFYRAVPVDKVIFLEERVKERRNDDCMLVSSEKGHAYFWNIYGVAQCGGKFGEIWIVQNVRTSSCKSIQ